MSPMVETVLVPLSAADRCDRCGAQAYIWARFQAGELLFCAHHGRKFETEIERQSSRVQDEYGRLSASL